MNKNGSIALIVILSILVVLLTGGFILLLKTNFSFNFSFNSFNSYSENLIESKEYDELKDLKIVNKTSDIFVEQSLDDKIKIEIYSDNNPNYSIGDSDNIINVNFEDKTKFNLFKKANKIIIKLPETYSNLLIIDSTTGDIKLDSFENLSPNLTVTTGDIEISNVNNLTYKSTTGDIKIQNANSVIGETTTGDIEINTANDISVKLTTGDIKINTINNKLSITNSTGDVKIENANIKENSSIDGKTGDIKISSISGCYVEGKSNVGDVNINNIDRKSDIVLTISVTTGDIRVN